FVGAHHQRSNLRQLGPQTLEHARAAEARHAEVEDHDVGAELVCERHGHHAVIGRTDDVYAGVLNERADDALTYDRMVLGDKHADLHLLISRASGRCAGADGDGGGGCPPEAPRDCRGNRGGVGTATGLDPVARIDTLWHVDGGAHDAPPSRGFMGCSERTTPRASTGRSGLPATAWIREI